MTTRGATGGWKIKVFSAEIQICAALYRIPVQGIDFLTAEGWAHGGGGGYTTHTLYQFCIIPVKGRKKNLENLFVIAV